MFDQLHPLVNQYITLNPKQRSLFESAFSFKQIPRKFVLESEGQVAKNIYFINKGLLRLYYNHDGEEKTIYIFREHLFAASYESFLQASPSTQCLESLEDTELLVLSKENLDMLYQELPQMNVLTRKIAEQRFINVQTLFASYLLESPEERYQKFEYMHGDLLLRVPHHIIASYLGMTPVSMSRIRKRLMGE